MVDTRNLAAHSTSQHGLPHWPAPVAWWHSRLQMMGPSNEKTEFFSFPATEHTGLHLVHPTWAGTFVLAAFVACFPDIHFILLDSDRLPVTLFEAADLWKEAFLTRFPPRSGKSLPTKHPLHRKQAFIRDPKVVYTQHRVNAETIGQGVLLVSEPHSELNAGFIVVFAPRTLHFFVGMSGSAAVGASHKTNTMNWCPNKPRLLRPVLGSDGGILAENPWGKRPYSCGQALLSRL